MNLADIKLYDNAQFDCLNMILMLIKHDMTLCVVVKSCKLMRADRIPMDLGQNLRISPKEGNDPNQGSLRPKLRE